ncbi:MAG: pentapeptide repeat-containing protein [Aphanizomenon flos-aquae Clear-A1]|nr:pentapeptide repeat-containing protein [Aphanizomenon flos-aquae Clear-A1]
MLVIAFSVFSGFLFLNPSPSYAYIRDLSGANLSRANLSRANLSRAIADSETIFPDGFDAVEEGVRFQN